MMALPFLGAVIMLGYNINNPAGVEEFTEMYILGIDGKAEAYPKTLTVGEEGMVLLGITNHEHEPMTYKVEMTVEGVPKKTIGPLELQHEETWEKEVSFAPSELCASSALAKMVDPGTGSYAKEITSIELESTEHLKPGDFILIDGPTEQRQVTSILNNTVRFTSPLKEIHDKGRPVHETQQVQFRLFKTRQLTEGNKDHTGLSLWLDSIRLDAAIINLGNSEAKYVIEVKVMAGVEGEDNEEREEAKLFSTGPETLYPDNTWNLDFSYRYPGAVWQNAELFIYRDDKLIYKEDALGGYPALHLWVNVVKSEQS